jgi:hypothetical protein
VVESRCLAKPSDDIEYLARAIMSCKLCELVNRLQIFVVTNCESPINSITNPNFVSIHLTRDKIFRADLVS